MRVKDLQRRIVLIGLLSVIFALRLPPISGQESLDAALERAITAFESLPNYLIWYREVGRTVDAQGGVVYVQPYSQNTGHTYSGVIDWLIVLAEDGGWRVVFPGDPNYRDALEQLSPGVMMQIDDSAYRPQPIPDILPRERLFDYTLPFSPGEWATVTRSYSEHGTGKIDFDLNGGAVTAAKDGVIVFAVDDRAQNTYRSGAWWAWNVVIIRHGIAEYSLYGHLAPGSIPEWIRERCEFSFRCDVPVQAGDVIGREGNTGYSSAPHLHVEFGQDYGVIVYLDVTDADQDGQRDDSIEGGYVYAEHDVGMSGYTPEQIRNWEYGALHQGVNATLPTPGENLIQDGGFAVPLDDSPWQPSGQINWQIADGVLRLTRLRTNDPPDWARVLQDTGISAHANMPMRVDLQLGNASASTKRVTITLLNADGRHYGELSCAFDLAANTPLNGYQFNGMTENSWADIRLEIAVNPADGSPAVLVDDVSLRYAPGVDVESAICSSNDS